MIDTVAIGAIPAVVAMGPTKRAVPVLDNVDWYTSPHLVVPSGLHRAFLQPYTPDRQPAERLRPLFNAALPHRECADLPALENAVPDRRRRLLAQPATIRARTNCHRWPADRAGLS